jgi:hypothetical protein
MKNLLSIFSILLVVLGGCASENNPPTLPGGGGQDDSSTSDPTGGPGSTAGSATAGSATAGSASAGSSATGADTTGADSSTTGADSSTTGADSSTTGFDPSMGSAVSDTVSATNTDSSSGDESTGGGECMPEMARYQCYGWVAGVYLREDVSLTNYQFVFGQNVHADCVAYEIVIPYVGDADNNPLVMDACRTECEAGVDAFEWPATEANGFWDFQRTVCVFAPNGNNGVIPNPTDGVANTPSGAANLACGVGHIGPVLGPDLPQTVYLGPAIDDNCAMAQCGSWDPAADVLYRYSSTTKTHTVRLEQALLDEILGNFGRDLMGCDDSRWLETFPSGGGTLWKAKNIVAGDLLYTMGLRTGDYAARVRKTTPITSAWYPLDSWLHIGTAFAALINTSALTIEFKRPKSTTPFYDVHTVKLTIQ